MAEDKFKALILRSLPVSDNAVLLTVLSDAHGKKLISCHGAKKLSGRTMPSVQPFCFSELTVTEKNGRLTVKEASLVESFYELREDLISLAVGSYMLEAAADCAKEEEDEKELLQLTLNCLFALNKKIASPDLVKTVFEVRLLLLEGSEPDFRRCTRCGKDLTENCFYSAKDGGTVCEACRAEDPVGCLPFDGGARLVLAHLTSCPPKRIFAFRASERSLSLLGRASEESVLFYFEHSFESLKFYNSVKGELPDF